MNRRTFLKRFGCASVSTAAVLASPAVGHATTGLTTDALVLDRRTVRIPSLAPAFEDYKIGYMSDLHLGIWVKDELIKQSINLLMEQQPDLILLGGDYLGIPDGFRLFSVPYVRNPRYAGTDDEHATDLILPALAEFLSLLKAPDGCFGVFGNHDRWLAGEKCRSALKSANIPLLQNQTATVKRGQASLRILGIDDYWTGIPRYPRDFAVRLPGETRILLSHNPDAFGWLFKVGGTFELGLAGHTHGGQVRFPLLGTPFYNIRDLRFAEGLVETPEWSILTSRGIGVVELPFRLDCPPEVHLLTLTAGEATGREKVA